MRELSVFIGQSSEIGTGSAFANKPCKTSSRMVAVAFDFMNEYADAFDELSNREAYSAR